MSNHFCSYFPVCQVQHKNADILLSVRSGGQTMTPQPCSMFSQTFVLNMTLLLVVIKDLGMTDVFFLKCISILFWFLCLWHQFSAWRTVSWKKKCGQEEEHKKNERMKMWKNLEGKKWEDKSVIERKELNEISEIKIKERENLRTVKSIYWGNSK